MKKSKKPLILISIGVVLLLVVAAPFLGAFSVAGGVFESGSLYEWGTPHLGASGYQQGEIASIIMSSDRMSGAQLGAFGVTINDELVNADITINGNVNGGSFVREVGNVPGIAKYGCTESLQESKYPSLEFIEARCQPAPFELCNVAYDLIVDINTENLAPGRVSAKIYKWTGSGSENTCDQLKTGTEESLLSDEWNYPASPEHAVIDGVEQYINNPIGWIDFYIEPAPCDYTTFTVMAVKAGESISVNDLPNYDANLGFCDIFPARWYDASKRVSTVDYSIYHDLQEGETIRVGTGQFLVLSWPISPSLFDAKCKDVPYDADSIMITADGAEECGSIAGDAYVCTGRVTPYGDCVVISEEYCEGEGAYYDPEFSEIACVVDDCERRFGDDAQFYESYASCGVPVSYSEACSELAAGFSYDYVLNKCVYDLGNQPYTMDGSTYNFYEIPLTCHEDNIEVDDTGPVNLYTCIEEPAHDCIDGRFYYSDADNLACVLGQPDCESGEEDAGNGICIRPDKSVVVKYVEGNQTEVFRTITKTLYKNVIPGVAWIVIFALGGLLSLTLGLVWWRYGRR